MSASEEVRLLSEIAHKLDYAIQSASTHGPGAPPVQIPTKLDPALLRGLHELIRPQTPEALYQRILDLAVEVSRAERGFLMLVEEGRKLRFKVGRSIDKTTLQKESETSRTLIKQVLQSGQPLFIADSSSGDVSSSSLKGLTLRSIICAPLLFGGQAGGGAVGGILYLDSRALVRTFESNHVELVQEVCSHGVSAIQLQLELVRLRGSFQPETSKLQENFERLLDVGRAISSTLVLDDLLELVIEKVLEVTRADRGFLMLLDETTHQPVFKIGLNWNKKDGPARRTRKLKETQFFYSRTVCNRALEEKQSVVLQDAQGGGGGDASVSIVQMDLHSVMVTPLLEKGEVLGLIYVDSKMSAKAFGASDVQLFEALAGQAAIGLKNALLYSKVAQTQRIESEIAIAAELQQDLCPKTTPEIQGVEICGFMTPAREVGGDYYDYVEDPTLPGQVLGILVGDVSGKGLGAGMVAVMARCFLRPMCGAYGMEDPSQLLTYLNSALVPELKPGKFMTMLLSVYDARTGVLRYASSGHENLIVWRAATRTSETIQSGGSPLGLSVTTGGPTANADLPLAVGDTLVLYTDGVTEAMNESDDEFTLERLVALVNQVGGRSAAEIQAAIVADIAKHRGTREQTDDITLVILRRL